MPLPPSAYSVPGSTGPQGPAGPPTAVSTAHNAGTSIALNDATPTTVAASNSGRVQIWVTNTSATELVSLSLGGTPSFATPSTGAGGTGIVLYPDQVWTSQVYTGAISGICSDIAGGSGFVGVVEV